MIDFDKKIRQMVMLGLFAAIMACGTVLPMLFYYVIDKLGG